MADRLPRDNHGQLAVLLEDAIRRANAPQGYGDELERLGPPRVSEGEQLAGRGSMERARPAQFGPPEPELTVAERALLQRRGEMGREREKPAAFLGLYPDGLSRDGYKPMMSPRTANRLAAFFGQAGNPVAQHYLRTVTPTRLTDRLAREAKGSWESTKAGAGDALRKLEDLLDLDSAASRQNEQLRARARELGYGRE